MKKTFIYITSILLGLFISITSVKATTKVSLTEKSNGNINTKLHFEEGFVGGVDVAFKVTGDVNVQNFTFNSKVGNKSGKTYSYDNKNKILKVRVTSGGIGTSHNLLDTSKELDLGNIVLNTTAKSTVSYSLTPTSLKVVDNSWNAKTIDTNADDKKDFNYNISTLENNTKPSTDNKVVEPSSGSKNSTTTESNSSSKKKSSSSVSSKNSSGSKNTTTSKSNSDDVTVDEANENVDEVTTDDTSEDIDDSIVDSDTKSTNTKINTPSKEVKKEKKKSKNIIPFIIGTGILAFIGIFVTIKNRY